MKNSTTQSKILIKIGVIFAWLIIWQIIYMCVDREILLVSPVTAFTTLIRYFRIEEFWIIVFSSLLRILLGYFIALILGCILAVISAKFNIIHIFFSPLIVVIKSTPVASFIILALVWMRTNSVPVFISFLMVFPLIYNNVYQGISSVDKKLLEMSEIYSFTNIKKVKFIYIPAVIPYFITAATTSLGFAWKSGIAAEVICTPKFSIGRQLYNSKIYLEIPELFAWTTAVILLSIVVEKSLMLVLNALRKRWYKWE